MMHRKINRLSSGLAALALTFAVAGCAQPPPAMTVDESASYRRSVEMGMVPEPSAESTNLSLWMDMHGGG
jgi:hypothetical protein